MASSEDFKKILELYNQEVKSSGVSIVNFCQQNGIVYSQFERWFRNRHKIKVHKVKVVDKDGISQTNTSSNSIVSDKKSGESVPALPIGSGSQSSTCRPLEFSVSIRSNSGICIQQSHINYVQLQSLVSKLDVLCSQ